MKVVYKGKITHERGSDPPSQVVRPVIAQCREGISTA